MNDFRISVLLADDSDKTRVALTRALALEADLSVTAAATASDVLDTLAEREIDVLVSDIHMPGNEELQLLECESVRRGSVAVILITGGASIQTAARAVRLRAFDYLTKPVEVEHLAARIRAADAQRKAELLNATILQAAQTLVQLHGAREREPAKLHHLSSLSTREREVAALVVEGVKVEEISARLHISRYTVRNHVRSMFTKLAVTSHSELVIKLLRG